MRRLHGIPVLLLLAAVLFAVPAAADYLEGLAAWRAGDYDAALRHWEPLAAQGDPDSSYLIDKVLNVPGICGGQMPVVGSISGEEIETLRQWIVDLGDSFGGTPDGG